MNDESRPRGRGVLSVEVSVALLTALARHRGPMTLSHLAAQVEMPAAKVHRYLASFVETGMVTHRRSGTYDLGALAAEIGLAALGRIDLVNAAADGLPGLVEETGLTGSLAVWGNRGPTIVRWEKAAVPLVTTLGLGSVLPVTRSATGHVFLAHLPDRIVQQVVREETGAGMQDYSALRDLVRGQGVATADQNFIPGLYALAAPVLNAQGWPEAVVTLIATSSDLLKPEALARHKLVQFAATLG